MAMYDEPSAKHLAFTEWSEKQGVVIDGVKPAAFAGKGLGIVATRHIKVVLGQSMKHAWTKTIRQEQELSMYQQNSCSMLMHLLARNKRVHQKVSPFTDN